MDNNVSHAHTRKVALVTGCSRGIGRAIGLQLAAEGMDLVVHYRREQAAADEVAGAAEALGVSAITVRADLESPEEIAAMFETVAAQWGRVDVLVANAAATSFKPLMDVTVNNIDRTLATVVRSFVLLVQNAVPLMRPGSSVIGISGMDADYVQYGHGLLGAAKSAMDVLVRNFAVELGDREITVNSVKPGFIPSDSSQMYLGEAYNELVGLFEDYTPVQRHLTVEDVANMVTYLVATPAARVITGENFALDGGLRLQGGPWRTLNDRLRDAAAGRSRAVG